MILLSHNEHGINHAGTTASFFVHDSLIVDYSMNKEEITDIFTSSQTMVSDKYCKWNGDY